MKHIFFLMSAAMLMSACSSSSTVSSPIAPSPSIPTTPAGPLHTYTLSGVVSELTANGRVPVEGVSIEVAICDAPCTVTALTAATDASGSYRLPEFPGSVARWVWVSKQGYRPDELYVTITADTRLDINVVRQ